MPEPTEQAPFGIEIAPRDGQEPPPEEPTQEEKPVTFDERQKARINEIVASASKRAGSEARAEAARLKAELDSARQTQTPSPGEDAALELASARAELAAVRAEQHESIVKSTLLAAVSGQNFFDAQLAADLLKQNCKLEGGKVVFLDSEGNQRLGSDFSPLTAAEAARELAAKRPFLVRGEVKGGIGSKLSDTVPNTGIKLEEIFGPRSNGGLSNRLALYDIVKWRQLREQARKKGIVG